MTLPRSTTSPRARGDSFSVILQDYLPIDDAEDWIVHAYCDASADCLAQFTGVKVRWWPLTPA